MCHAPKSTYQDKVLKNKVDKVITHESEAQLRDELMVVFKHRVGNMPKTPNKFTSMLKHRNVKTERLHIDGKAQYGLRTEWKAPKSWIRRALAEFARQPRKQNSPGLSNPPPPYKGKKPRAFFPLHTRKVSKPPPCW